MANWDNKISSQGIHYSRYGASYRKELEKLGMRFYWSEFIDWLIKIGLREDEVYDIANMAECGKLELETSAMVYLTNLKKNTKTES